MEAFMHMDPKKKAILASVLGVLAIVVVSLGGYLFWANQLPAMPENADDVVALLSDSRFENLPPERREVYVQRMFDIRSTLDEDERRRLFDTMRDNDIARDNMRVVMEQSMVSNARAFARASEEERQVILANVSQMFQGMRPPGQRGDGGQRGEGGQRPEGGDRDSRRERMQERIMERAASGNPQDSAMIREFFTALRQQREQQRNNG
ncbi:MAG: hypothetical protein RLN76_00345 [Phycisphaeraceae bacterium]